MKIGLELVQWLVLFLVISIAAIFFQQTFANINRFFIILMLAIFYVAWGYWHHAHKDRLDKTVLLEYSLVSLIVTLIAALGMGIIRFF